LNTNPASGRTCPASSLPRRPPADPLMAAASSMLVMTFLLLLGRAGCPDRGTTSPVRFPSGTFRLSPPTATVPSGYCFVSRSEAITAGSPPVIGGLALISASRPRPDRRARVNPWPYPGPPAKNTSR
jgi:hypothetical protein